jgi:hypothetical protein
VVVDSRLGRGASFIVTLPRDPRHAEAAAGLALERAPGSSPEKPDTIPERPAEVTDSSSAHPPLLNPEAPR